MARRMLTVHGHPLADKQGHVLRARAVLFEKIGYGPHLCQWCGRVIGWGLNIHKNGGLTADHIDHDTVNDAPDNLVQSCQSCNLRRSKVRVRDDEPYVVYQGVRHRAVLRVCETCGATFPHSAADKRPSHGRFCSRRCMYDRRR